MGKTKGYFDVNSEYRLEQHSLSGLPDLSKDFLVLGIETSCDDTGVGIVRSNGEILSNVIFSQNKIHEKFGGVVPSLAMEAHQKNINEVINEALFKANIPSIQDIDAIAVTKGPGLEICLRVGFNHAKELACLYRKPFVTVNHLEAHCLTVRLAGKIEQEERQEEERETSEESTMSGSEFIPKLCYPFLALLVSGGHSSLLICHSLGHYTTLGGTLDDALGEAFDKAARMVGVSSERGGGAAVERCARDAREQYYQLPVPMRDKRNCDFSFAGLKNAFRLTVARAQQSQVPLSAQPSRLPDDLTNNLCAAFQDAAFSHVEDRVAIALDAAAHLRVPITALAVVGGVAANSELRRRLHQLLAGRAEPLPLLSVSPSLCTDNGAMVAWTGVEKLLRGISDDPEAEAGVLARWPLGRLMPLDERKAAFQKRK